MVKLFRIKTDAGEALVRFKMKKPNTVCTLAFVHPQNVIAVGFAKLAAGDEWNTDAGMRIALDRMLSAARSNSRNAPNFSAAIPHVRRVTQIHLALLRAQRKVNLLGSALQRAARECITLTDILQNTQAKG